MMRLYFMRHGRAVPESATLVNFKRYLTDLGKAETKCMADQLAAHVGETPIGIYISPLVRTQETAVIMAAALRRSASEVVTSATLYALCRDDWRPVAQHLAQVQEDQGLTQALLISHQPFLEKWLRELTGTELFFQRSGIAVVDWEPTGKSRLVAYLTPTYWEETK